MKTWHAAINPLQRNEQENPPAAKINKSTMLLLPQYAAPFPYAAGSKHNEVVDKMKKTSRDIACQDTEQGVLGCVPCLMLPLMACWL
jgi:hypothetical protein